MRNIGCTLVFFAALAATAASCSRTKSETGAYTLPIASSSATAVDSVGDGIPDDIRLDSEHDRDAFRGWFTFLAEVQFFTPETDRPKEISDCAALLRFAYREALRKHDSAWSAETNWPWLPALESVKKYNYPRWVLGPALFRCRGGTFQRTDLQDGAFAQFADAQTLLRYNTYFVTRRMERAQAGDLIFFERKGARQPFHSMIYVGKSLIRSRDELVVVYDTGAEGGHAGEMRRRTLRELLNYPQPEWRPIESNEYFLGVYRWNILRVN